MRADLLAALDAHGIRHREGRFPDPKNTTHVVWTDDVDADGPDGINCIFLHNSTFELYAPTPEKMTAAEKVVEDALNAAGLRWKKFGREWMREDQRYMTIYEFNYIEKRRF